MNEEQKLDQLFALAREQAPEVSFDETKKRFLGAAVLAAGGVLATKGIIKLLTTKKWIIMISGITVITSGAVVATSLMSSGEEIVAENRLIENNNLVTSVLTDSVAIEEQMVEEQMVNKEDTFVYTPNNAFVAPVDITELEVIALAPQHQEIPMIAFVDDDTNKVVKAKDEDYTNKYVITRKTTEAEFDAIKKSAEEAGIDFSYSVKSSDDRLDKFSIHMKMKHKREDGKYNRCTANYQIDYEDDDADDSRFVFGWLADDDGKAVKFRSGEKSNINRGPDCNCGGIIEIPEIPEVPNFEFDFDFSDLNFADSICIEIPDVDFTFNYDGMHLNRIPGGTSTLVIDLEGLNESMRELQKDLDQMNKDLQEETKELLQEVNEELKKLQKELEEEMKEIEKDLEEQKKAEEEKKREEEKE
ncbi:hypothetical protein K6119_02095 [Paracrocinitomix mangrovi]|uniref:hypothetical protein n=1 Tax=Paracrocinitomix mangrovi TaxID=2862509 RepID=UPI001C8EB31D|nr:hypothetical protein [Paracrocinitomix mangrovi]UKN02310.1 hypothetical protein K6119_02095 [Paracrocinitomix mangrovi]